jgi:hypothetical protein
VPGETCRSSVDAVVVSPAQVTLAPGASQVFTVVVQGAANQAVTWSVSGGGTITPTGTFTSDGTTGTFYVRATSAEDPNAVGLAQITVGSTPPPPPPPPPPPTRPCFDTPCIYRGIWTTCDSRNGPRVCWDETGRLLDPELRDVGAPGGPGYTRFRLSFKSLPSLDEYATTPFFSTFGTFTGYIGLVPYGGSGRAEWTVTPNSLSIIWGEPSMTTTFTGTR